MEERRLTRSKTDTMIGGVCGGLGKYFGIDPTLVRLIFVLLVVLGGGGVVIYLILWIVMPLEGRSISTPDQTIRDNAQDLADRARDFGRGFEGNTANPSRSGGTWFGIILILLGIGFLAQNLLHLNLSQFWPVLLILIGVVMFVSAVRKPQA